MKSDLFFDFSINKENNTIVIKREFDANLEQVWQAHKNRISRQVVGSETLQGRDKDLKFY